MKKTIKRALGVGKELPFSGLVRDWEEEFGSPRPKVATLIGLSTSGSHFVLHKLQGHPQIIALSERALYPQLKHYFREGVLPIADIAEAQLRPHKENFRGVEWIVVNKPQMAFISYNYLFNRADIRTIYCFRNPIALYHSRVKDNQNLGARIYGAPPTWRELATWIRDEYALSLASFAQVFDPQLDYIINLESMAAQLDEGLDQIWELLGVEEIGSSALRVLETCEQCGRSLDRKLTEINGRQEEVLYCTHDDLLYTAPGGYNYVRKVAPEKLASWKGKEHAEDLKSFFKDAFGGDLIQFFDDETYLKSGGNQIFYGIVSEVLQSYKRE